MSETSPDYKVFYNHNTLLESRNFIDKTESIYTVTLVSEDRTIRPRCFGFFSRFSDALYHINHNGINGLDEAGQYKYLIIEKMYEGLYTVSEELEQTWFKVNYELKQWEEIKKPKKFKGIINFGIG